MTVHRIGILTGGGDAPGLNAVIRGVVKYAVGKLHWQVIGIEDSFGGLLDDPPSLLPLNLDNARGLLHKGGTVLGTTNKGDPFAWKMPDGSVADRSIEVARAVEREGLEGLIVIGGDGTQKIGYNLMKEHGTRVVGVPKTIDNDLMSTDLTFGFQTAVAIASEALDRLHTTAESHDRVMLLEVMGRDAGWIALYAGVAGGADCIAIPEIPYDVDRFAEKIRERRRHGRNFTVIVVAEGAKPKDGSAEDEHVRHGKGLVRSGGAALTLAHLIAERIECETRVTVLGHLQRGGTPEAMDRVLATQFGVHAVELIDEGRWGEMVSYRNGDITSARLEDIAGITRMVDPDHPLIQAARRTGIVFGG